MSYGFEILDSNGNVVIDSSDTTARIIHIQYVAYNTSSATTFTVSSFDSTTGFYYVKPHITPVTFASATATTPNKVYDSVTDVNFSFPFITTSDNRYYWEMAGGHSEANLSWDNSTKVMTVNPSAPFSHIPDVDLGNMEIVFMEYA